MSNSTTVLPSPTGVLVCARIHFSTLGESHPGFFRYYAFASTASGFDIC